MPSVSTVYRWMTPGKPGYDPLFRRQYAAARLWQRETYLDKLLDVARADGLTGERRKAEMDALKTVLSQLESKRYAINETGETTVRVVYEDAEEVDA